MSIVTLMEEKFKADCILNDFNNPLQNKLNLLSSDFQIILQFLFTH